MQAVPLVASASLGHLLFGDFQLDLTVSLLIGALPGVYVGARVSSSAPGGIIRRALVAVLLASGLKLLEVPNWVLVAVLLAVAVVGPVLWATVYRSARPDQVGRGRRGPKDLLLAAVTGRWLSWGDTDKQGGEGSRRRDDRSRSTSGQGAGH